MKKENKILPFHQAILDADFKKMEKFINKGTDINLIDENGRSSTYYAIFSKSLNVLKWVIDRGADINYIYSIDGDNLLHIAAGEGRIDMVKYLINEHHFDVNSLNNNNETPLSCSMIFTQMPVACYLIEKGAVKLGKIICFEALLKYIENEIAILKRCRSSENNDAINCKISALQAFLDANLPKINKPKNYKEIDKGVENVLINIGIKKGRELAFYKRNLDYADKQQLSVLYEENPKSQEIRSIIWKCYFSNYITTFYTAGGIEPAYTLPFTKEAVLRDYKKNSEIDICDFIKDIPAFLPKFGVEYYLIKHFGVWMSLNRKDFEPIIEDVKVANIPTETQKKLQNIFMHYVLDGIELMELNEEYIF